MIPVTEKLTLTQNADDNELRMLIESSEYDSALIEKADGVRRKYYGDDVYIRGLIEISNYCRNNCYYCGIRCGNSLADRYRLESGDILSCCESGYELGFRTFVMQGGEDEFYTDDYLCNIIDTVKARFSGCAVTLSLGERSYESYRRLFEAGADRYLLRHETADAEHYSMLHPQGMSLDERKRCLFNLKEIGYQVGSGFMVGSPYQTTQNLIADLRFLQELQPDMIGIGPFIRHKDTPFNKHESGTAEAAVKMIAILRLMFPYALIPSTTALGTIHPNGREMGLRAGANVVMPNLSPALARGKYNLYDNKISTGAESAEGVAKLTALVESAGYRVAVGRGDVKR